MKRREFLNAAALTAGGSLILAGSHEVLEAQNGAGQAPAGAQGPTPATPKHKANAKRLDDEGMATLLGDAADVSFGVLEEAVKILLDDPMERLTMSRCARNRIDGRGGDRVVNGMEIMLHAPSRAVPAAAVAA